jgi:hypothetical protein
MCHPSSDLLSAESAAQLSAYLPYVTILRQRLIDYGHYLIAGRNIVH